jgi:UDP-N-acetylglucosamine--dolichyl-phosphate N-acetylglucosaminephosphotransferase
MFIYFLLFLTILLIALAVFPLIIPKLKRNGIVGKDMNKPGMPELPEMGGLVMVSGFSIGLILAIGLEALLDSVICADSVILLAVLTTVLTTSLIGIFDDLMNINQKVKALLPLLAAFPLMAIKAGTTTMKIPFLGWIDFGIFYPLFLIPLGVTGAANAVNMLAGFNGLEMGMAAVAISSLAIIAYYLKSMMAFAILIIALPALLATLYYNWYPAKILVGDVGTLSIGAIIASAVIIGNFETAGVIIIIPYFFDFLIKLINGLPSKGWWGIYSNDKLYCPDSGPVGLCQLVMKIANGITERNLVLTLMGIEAVFSIIAILFYIMK